MEAELNELRGTMTGLTKLMRSGDDVAAVDLLRNATERRGDELTVLGQSEHE